MLYFHSRREKATETEAEVTSEESVKATFKIFCGTEF